MDRFELYKQWYQYKQSSKNLFMFLAPVRDSENEIEMNNFAPETEEEKELLDKIKSSFRCWQKKEDSHLETKTAKSRLIQLLKLAEKVILYPTFLYTRSY